MKTYDLAIVGAGIVGLAHAYHASKRGLRVAVFERSARAVGASIRNFGMIWPVGQPLGRMRELALRSRGYWLEVLNASGIWHRKCGSLHLAYARDEFQVLSEFVDLCPACQLMSPDQVKQKSPLVTTSGLVGGMWSDSELCVFPRQVVSELPGYLNTSQAVDFYFDHAVTAAETGSLIAGGKAFNATKILICPGDDLTTLYPGWMLEQGLTLSKLQMLRARPSREGFDIEAHLCAGLTLAHYGNFRACPSLSGVVERFHRDYPDHMKHGIHLLVSQHQDGMLTIGDSHDYGNVADPFLSATVDSLIIEYLATFLPVDELEIVERWHGVYAKHPTLPYLNHSPVADVHIVAALGGAGMTLSFGVAAETIEALF